MKLPELLAPAGDLEKLITAINYGADAVYMGGAQYGLRAKAKNFDVDEMAAGIAYAHKYGKKVYVTANIFAHNEDIDGMGDFFVQLERLGVDAVLISDPGVFTLAREAAPNLEIHISTQANTTNYRTVRFWHDMGATRVVLARELSIEQIAHIRQHVPAEIELESFIHGAMCISMSGRCLLSNYMTSRDANRGECSQPCRWNYHLVEATRPDEHMPVFEDKRGTYIFNSKDLCLIGHIPELIGAGIASLKIEGRMKTPYYVAVTTKAYRQALDNYTQDPSLYTERIPYYLEELTKASHRGFTTGFAISKPDEADQVYGTSSYIRTYDFIGVVKEYDSQTGMATIEQRGKFSVGDHIEALPCIGAPFPIIVDEIIDTYGKSIDSAPHAQQIVRIKVPQPLRIHDMLRRECSS